MSANVPDNFPDAAYVSTICDWIQGKWCDDGVSPFILDIAQQCVGEIVEQAIMASAFHRVCEHSPQKAESVRNMKRRDREAKELQKCVQIDPYENVHVSVRDIRSTGEFVVAYKTSVREGGTGDYELENHRGFASLEEARAYADTCDPLRMPVVISVP